MTAVVKTQIQPHPVGKEVVLSSNIPFLDRNPDAFSTRFQEDFQPLSTKKAEDVRRPTPAQVDHKDLRYIKEYLTEAMDSYQRHPLPQMTRTQHWTTLCTNKSHIEIKKIKKKKRNSDIHSCVSIMGDLL